MQKDPEESKREQIPQGFWTGWQHRVTDQIAGRSQAHLMWGVAGLLLIGLFLVLAALSPQFAYERDLLSKPILALVGIGLLAGVPYLLAVAGMRHASDRRGVLILAIAVGVVLRASMFTSTPMLEDDYYRYLWDGAVVSKGVSPYLFAPSQILESEAEADEQSGSVPPVLHQLADESGTVVWRINHPHLRTIYPPVTQAAFALAHWLRPWSLFAWRWVLLAFDFATLGLLVNILRTLKLPLLWLIIYWWNPLLVKEIYNSGHMDIVILPFVLGAVLLTIRGKHLWAGGSLGLATGAKIWPVVLLPVLFRPIGADPKKLLPALGVFGLLAGTMFLPVYSAGLDDSSGFVTYGQSWENNEALFLLIRWGVQGFLQSIGAHPGHGQLVARVVVGVILVVWIAWLAGRKPTSAADVCQRCRLIIAAVFLLSPAQVPWYYVWLVPFLAIRPRWSLLLLTVLLPLYYLRFYFDARDSVGIFDWGIVWLEYGPVWYLLIREWHTHRHHRPIFLQEVTA